MRWYLYVAYVSGGASLVNAVRHFVNGVSGRSFPTPFASPPGKGLPSPVANVLWARSMLWSGTCSFAMSGSFTSASFPVHLPWEPEAF